jgi:hypothetical protein
MELRNKLLIHFGLLIFVTLTSFGFSAYQAAYKNAIDKDKQLLETHVLLDTDRYSTILRDSNSFEKIFDDLSEHSIGNHLYILVDEDFRVVNMESIDSPILRPFLDQGEIEKIREQGGSGEVIIDDIPYVWAKAALEGSSYNVLYIEKTIEYNNKGLSKLASRLFG